VELKNEFEVLNSNIDNLEVTCNPSNLTWNDRTWKLHVFWSNPTTGKKSGINSELLMQVSSAFKD